MRKTPTVVTGVAIAAGGLMAAALVTPTLSASADGDDGSRKGHETSSRKLTAFSCNGGATKAVRNIGVFDGSFTVPAGDTRRLPGTIKLKGPKKRKDVVSVTLTGNVGLGSSSIAFADVLVDGKPLRPGTLTSSVIVADSEPNTHTMAAAQFCGKIGKGRHNVKIRFRDTGNGHHYDSVVAHVEQNN